MSAHAHCDDTAAAPPRGLRGGPAAQVLLKTLTVVAAVMAVALGGTIGAPADAQTSASPVLSCPGSMVLDAQSGQCRTPRTATVQRPSSCPSGWTKVAGQYGGHVRQRRVESQRDTGRTRQVYSHTTYDDVWIVTGTQRQQTGTVEVWVPSRTIIEPLVPPVRVQVGTRTETTVVTRPGPDVLYEVSYEVQVETQRVVRRCAFDPFAGQNCWNETITETRTEQRTRFECCIPGPPVRVTLTTEVPVYKWQRTHAVTVPGYWRDEPEYTDVETGYWDRVPTLHYTTEPIYETVVEWQSTSATSGSCRPGWRAAGRQCQRTVLGAPTAAPTQSCPAGTVPRYSDSVGGVAPTVASCGAPLPSTGLDNGDDQERSGGSHPSPDGTARPLHHLAGESDERLAELGIHRCSDGLLSYVPCDELPGREWDSDGDVCDAIDGTVYRREHGGSCVTESDLLNKCVVPGDCQQTTVRTYCPAIGELSGTQIQEHVHPHRGPETYRVCVFNCSNFGVLPPYVQCRINGSYDYSCLPHDDEENGGDDGDDGDGDDDEDGDGGDDDEDGDDDDDGDGDDGDGGDDDDGGGERRPGNRRPSGDEPVSDDPDDGSDPERPDDDHCSGLPAESEVLASDGELVWASFVGVVGENSSPQHQMPGGGRYLRVAPGRGWIETHGSLDVRSGECTWIATRLRATWSELRPWVASERRQMVAAGGLGHLLDQWDALSVDQKQLVRQWHTPSAVPQVVECTASATARSGGSACRWLLRRPAAFGLARAGVLQA